MERNFAVIALFDFGKDGPVFTEFVAGVSESFSAFCALDRYDVKKVIASTYTMNIIEILSLRHKEFGVKKETNKLFYEEQRNYEYCISGDEESYRVKVTLTIYEM